MIRSITILFFVLGVSVFCFHPARAAVESVSIGNLVVVDGQGSALETKVYPGYTMSFDVAVVSSFDEEQPVMFEYAIVDMQGDTVYMVAEERQLSGENVFTKKMTLPRSIKEGNYRLKITSNAGGKEIVQMQDFEIVRSPITKVKENNQAVLAGLFGPNSWLLGAALGVVLVMMVIMGMFLLLKKSRASRKGA